MYNFCLTFVEEKLFALANDDVVLAWFEIKRKAVCVVVHHVLVCLKSLRIEIVS